VSKEFKRMQKLAGINEIKINKPSENYKAIINKSRIPTGWDEIEPYQDEEDENIKIAEFIAPSEGWDWNNMDHVFIEKTPEGKFIIDSHVAFGDFGNAVESNTFSEAIIDAIEIMNNFKEDWDDIDDYERDIDN
jgi:hypothetical protein